MKILILSTGKTEEYDDSFSARLIEQGRAVLPPPDPAKPAAGAKNAPARKARKAEPAEPETKTDKE